MALEITHQRVFQGHRIIGRTDLKLISEIRSIRGPRLKPNRLESYHFDYKLVGTVFKRLDNGVLYVLRSVIEQYYLTGYVLNGTLIQKSGSSTTHVIKSLSDFPLMETEEEDKFYQNYEIVKEAPEVKTCIYCGSPVDKNDTTYFSCGTHRSYYKHRPDNTSECNIFRGKHSMVHHSYIE